MKLSLVFELLMIFVLLAFAASKSVKHKHHKKAIQNKSEITEVDTIEDNSINKYCKCVEAYCNCCRDFALPLVNLNGPGCASLMYLNGDKMAVSLSFGKKVITNRTLSSRKASPVCMPLPGGFSKFCGRVYNIARTGEEFRACLALELQSKSVVEAAVRVSCFKFGPKGVKSEPADPLPLVPDEKGDKDDEDDDDDDEYGLGGDDDDDDDEDADDDDDESELEAVNDVGESDYTGFSLLEEDLLGDLFGSSGGKKGNKNKNSNKNKNQNKKKQAPTSTTTKRPRSTRRPSSRRPSSRTTTLRPIRTTTVKVRPVNKRPTRRPSRRPARPNRTSITPQVAEITPSSIVPVLPSSSTTTTTTTTTTSTTATPIIAPVTAKIQIVDDQANEASDTFEPIVAVRPLSTTPKSVTDFEHTGLEMSLAHITGQLSSMPVVSLTNKPKNSGMATKPNNEQVTYQKVEIITPKVPTTLSVETSSLEESVNDDMIQIVQSLDSVEEAAPTKETMTPEESRAYFSSHPVRGEILNGAFPSKQERPRGKDSDELGLPDLDVLDLTQIGETIGDELGIFGGKKREIKDDENTKLSDDNEYSEYEDVMDTVGEALLLARKSHPKNKNKKKRGRQNKMMRGDWAHV